MVWIELDFPCEIRDWAVLCTSIKGNLVALQETLSGDSDRLHHVNIASVCRSGSLCVSLGLNASVLWTVMQLLFLVFYKTVELLPFHFNHFYLQKHAKPPLHVQHLSSPLALLASMCMPVLHTVSHMFLYILMAWIAY